MKRLQKILAVVGVLALFGAALGVGVHQATVALSVPGEVAFQTPVVIEQAAAGRTTIYAGLSGHTIRLHELVGTMTAAGTAMVCYDNDGAGTSQTAISGIIPLASTGGMVVPFRAEKAGCLATPAGKYLTIVTVGGAFHGWAIVSIE